MAAGLGADGGALEERVGEVALVLLFAAGVQLLRHFRVEPYMDEPFHVGQTQQYCRGDFTAWDPKITTLPGLYLWGAAFGRVLALLPEGLLSLGPLCSHEVLRLSELPLHALTYVAARALAVKLHGRRHAWLAALVVLLPTQAFYALLYYTDVGSLAFCLLTHLAALNRRYVSAALAAVAAILFRQTNAVWVSFSLGAALLQEAAAHQKEQMLGPGGEEEEEEELPGQEEPGRGLEGRGEEASQEERDKGRKEVGTRRSRRKGAVGELSLWRELTGTLQWAWQDRWQLLWRTSPLLLVLGAFCGFVWVNGGIVVGDRSNHTPVLHWVQPLYLLLATCGALAPVHFCLGRLWEGLGGLGLALRQKPWRTLGVLAASGAAVGFCIRHGTLAHPFLLADNRHYTFYLWKDFFARHALARYALTPVYLYCGWSLWESLRGGGASTLWVLGLAACSAAVLIPAWLVEFRYFTTPLVLTLLHARPPSPLQAALVTAAYVLVNCAVLYVFAARPFRWLDGSVARFMW